MNKCKIFLIIIFSTLVLIGCKLDNFDEGDFFYIRNKGADMPVWVVGNKDSRVFVIHLHGGPGGSAISYNFTSLFADLKAEYAQVYYDQRSSGFSVGVSSIENLTMSQFVEDLNAIVDAISIMYNNPDIFLIGASWGGALGTGYLLDPVRQGKIKGWIELDGSHNNVLGNQLSRQFVLNYANSQINSPSTNSETKQKWTEIRSFYEKNTTINFSNLQEHATYVVEAHGYVPKGAEPFDQAGVGELIFSTRADMLLYLINANFIQSHFDTTGINFTSQMTQITLPALIIWGQHDGILPVPLAQQALDSLGTLLADKSIVILPNSGHTPVKADLSLFNSSIISFVESYRSP